MSDWKAVSPARHNEVVNTWPRNQNGPVRQTHRGWLGRVARKVPGTSQWEYSTCCFHQKMSAAKAHAEKYARFLNRQEEESCES